MDTHVRAAELLQELQRILSDRNYEHGDAREQFDLYFALRSTLFNKPLELESFMAQSIDMVLTKLSRIASGQAHNKDHWIDIAGYAILTAAMIDSDDMQVVETKPTASGHFGAPSFNVDEMLDESFSDLERKKYG